MKMIFNLKKIYLNKLINLNVQYVVQSPGGINTSPVRCTLYAVPVPCTKSKSHGECMHLLYTCVQGVGVDCCPCDVHPSAEYDSTKQIARNRQCFESSASVCRAITRSCTRQPVQLPRSTRKVYVRVYQNITCLFT